MVAEKPQYINVPLWPLKCTYSYLEFQYLDIGGTWVLIVPEMDNPSTWWWASTISYRSPGIHIFVALKSTEGAFFSHNMYIQKLSETESVEVWRIA